MEPSAPPEARVLPVGTECHAGNPARLRQRLPDRLLRGNIPQINFSLDTVVFVIVLATIVCSKDFAVGTEGYVGPRQRLPDRFARGDIPQNDGAALAA